MIDPLTPRQVVEALDRYVIGQSSAKKSVAIALRNRWRRRHIDDSLGLEVMPANILMIGPTGVGKTEIARRLAQLAGAPFIKVEATKFTEVGYIGRDVESMIRDLMEAAVSHEKRCQEEKVLDRAKEVVNERLLSLLVKKEKGDSNRPGTGGFHADPDKDGFSVNAVHVDGDMSDAFKNLSQISGFPDIKHMSEMDSEPDTPSPDTPSAPDSYSEQKNSSVTGSDPKEFSAPEEVDFQDLREKLLAGELEEDMVTLEVTQKSGPTMEIFSSSGIEELGFNIGGVLGGMFQPRKESRTMKISEAREHLMAEESAKLLDFDEIVKHARDQVEESGIVFLDEIDKVVGTGSSHGPDVSRQGVQRDLLPLVEGSTVVTKYGAIKTEHILFIGAGAFHSAKPTDLIPELQGRFPIRVELQDLELEDYKRILREPKNSLLKQVKALLKADGVDLEVTDEGVDEIARTAWELNASTSNIGARRLFTVMEKLVEDISFGAPDTVSGKVLIDRAEVVEKLGEISKEEGIAKFIL